MLVAPLRRAYPDLKLLQAPNNAEILQLKLYLTGLFEFSELFERRGRSWSEFFKAIQVVREKLDQDGGVDPFDEITRL